MIPIIFTQPMENQENLETDVASLKSIMAELQDIAKSEKASAALNAIKKELDHRPRYVQFQLLFLRALRDTYAPNVPEQFENEFTAAYNRLRTELTDNLTSVDALCSHWNSGVGLKQAIDHLEPKLSDEDKLRESGYDGYLDLS